MTHIIDTDLVQEMKKAFTDYALSVVVSRAIPDVRDGLKPVHRRILFGMIEGNYRSSGPFRKSARVVGDVMGKYHPHGDAAIYDALVRMAQDFSMSLPLIEGQGNFGSIDNDPPAAMRYTEVRMNKIAETMLEDLYDEAVDWRPNYDGSEQEPVVLPARFPNLLVNGAEGIAVGIATRIPPHNLAEVCAATRLILSNSKVSLEELSGILVGPDFPTGGKIVGRSGLLEAARTGRGSIRLRGSYHIEEGDRGRNSIVFDELPYQVVKSDLYREMLEAKKANFLEGVVDIRDESGKQGIRLVIDLKSEADSEAVVRQLFARTRLEIVYPVNQMALAGGRPKQMGVLDVLQEFIDFRRLTVRRRTVFALRKQRKLAMTLVGRILAISRIDDIVRIIRTASDAHCAQEALLELEFGNPGGVSDALYEKMDGTKRLGVWRLSHNQAKEILELRLSQITALEREKLESDASIALSEINRLLDILQNASTLDRVIDGELERIIARYGHARRTEIIDVEDDGEDALVPRKDVLLIVTQDNWAKRVDQAVFRAQARGGKGKTGAAPRQEDAVSLLVACNTRDRVLAFTNTGRVFSTKAWRFPDSSADGRGRPLVNILRLQEGERIISLLAISPETSQDNEIVLFTANGRARRNALSDFASVPVQGKRAFPEGEQLVSVVNVSPKDDLMVVTRLGQSIRFSSENLRLTHSRIGHGVRAIALAPSDEVVSALALPSNPFSPEEIHQYLAQIRRLPSEGVLSQERIDEIASLDRVLLLVDRQGLGRRTRSHVLRRTNRGGKGSSFSVRGGVENAVCILLENGLDLIVLTRLGRLIRVPGLSIRVGPKRGAGVVLLRIPEGDSVAGCVAVQVDNSFHEENEEEILEDIGE